MYLFKIIINNNKIFPWEMKFPQGIKLVHDVVWHSKFFLFTELNCC